MSDACAHARTRLPWFVGGDLDAREAETVRAHLIACVDCRNEAAGLQRAVVGLRAAAAEPVAGVDDAMFAAMHANIVERVAALDGEQLQLRRVAGQRWALAAAALALVGVGFWLGHGAPQPNVLTRTATTVGDSTPIVVPYSGQRAMRALGNDVIPDDGREGSSGTGLRGRDELRTLIDDGMVLPPRSKRPR